MKYFWLMFFVVGFIFQVGIVIVEIFVLDMKVLMILVVFEKICEWVEIDIVCFLIDVQNKCFIKFDQFQIDVFDQQWVKECEGLDKLFIVVMFFNLFFIYFVCVQG